MSFSHSTEFLILAAILRTKASGRGGGGGGGGGGEGIMRYYTFTRDALWSMVFPFQVFCIFLPFLFIFTKIKINFFVNIYLLASFNFYFMLTQGGSKQFPALIFG